MNAVETVMYIILGAVSDNQVSEKPIKEKAKYTKIAITIETNTFFIVCCF